MARHATTGGGTVTDLVIEAAGLRKEFRGRRGVRVAVENLDLAVPGGGVHGFLGPNGSGKTTTIRMLLGLARATRGEMRLFGQPVPESLPAVIDRVGAVVESPKFSPHFTGRQNLLLLSRSIGAPDTRVDAAIETVGLTGRDGDRFKSYSLGMKQRLAIAATLLKDPQLLILDEPTNGLDPAARNDMLRLVERIGSEFGIAVLVTSHLLGELEQVSDHVIVLDGGHLLRSSATGDFLQRTGSLLVEVVGTEVERDRLGEALARRGLTCRPRGAMVAIDPPPPELAEGGAVHDLIRDVAADLGLGLMRL
jgi:ABC-2 type transport system ATP-binding protein